MTHDSRTISAVFMAVVLILASGTAVSLAVTDSSSDVGTNAAAIQDETTTEDDGLVNDTTTEDGVETEDGDDGATDDEGEDGEAGDEGEAGDDEGEESDDEGMDDEEAAQSASITINEQESDGETVVVESVSMDEGGFVAIYEAGAFEGAPLTGVLGNSVYLDGDEENVEITLARPIDEGQTLVAVPHQDTNDNQVFDYVLSSGALDGPYTVGENESVADRAEVSVPQDTTTTEDETETTTEEDGVTTVPEETTTEEDDLGDVTTTEEDDLGDETTTEEEIVDETTTEEEEEVVDETTTEEEDVVEEEPTDEQQLVFKVENMEIDEWSFVVGDEEEPDRTEVISDVNVQDRRVEVNLTEMLQEQQEMAERQTVTTVDPEEAQEQLEENLSQDLETVRIVVRNVDLENVTLVVTAPEGMDLPEPPTTTTTEEPTTTEEETTVETITTEEETTEEVTTIEETTEEVTTIEDTTTEEVTTIEETTEEVTTIEDTTEEETTEEVTTVEETTTEDEGVAELDSFDVSELDAPESASVGDTITVSATVSNPNDEEATQDVAFRLDGTVVERQSVTLDANDQETVTFEIDTTDVPAGQYVHGVYTQDFGELAVVVLEDPSDGEDGDEEDTGDETTTAPGEDDGETVTVETTTVEEA